MRIGKGTLRAAFDIASEKGTTSRKEISSALGISMVAAHAAVDALVEARLLSVEKDSPQSTSSRGRKSEGVMISGEKLCLVIDFCKKNVNFAISPLYNRINSFEIIPYSDMLDIEVNLDIAASEIKRFIERNNAQPSFVALAIPEFDENFSIKDCTTALKKVGLVPDLIVSGATAASEFCASISNERFAFATIDNRVWGCSFAEPRRMIPWESIKVGAHHGESFASVLHYETDEQKLCIYANRFINSIDAVLSPDKIFITATALPDAVMKKLRENEKVVDLSADTPVLNGLLRLSRNEIFNRSFNN